MVIVGGPSRRPPCSSAALPTVWFQGLADGAFGRLIGHHYLGLPGAVHPYYVMTTIFVILFRSGKRSIRRAFTNTPPPIAPKGQEASYAALSCHPVLCWQNCDDSRRRFRTIAGAEVRAGYRWK